jgi:hypothetical protein
LPDADTQPSSNNSTADGDRLTIQFDDALLLYALLVLLLLLLIIMMMILFQVLTRF